MSTKEETALAEKALKFVLEHYEPARKAFELADAEICKAKVKVGEYLFKEFFDADLETMDGEKKYNPKKENSYKLLLEMDDFPISRSGVRNMVWIGYQSEWLKQKRVNLTQLIESGKVGYTGLVRMSSMKNTDKKLLLIKEIEERKTAYTISELKGRITALSKDPVTFPPDFEEVMSSGWMQEVLREKVTLAAQGVELPAEVTEIALKKFLDDLKNAKDFGHEPNKGITKSRATEMALSIRAALQKAHAYVSKLHLALEIVTKKEEDTTAATG